MTLNFSYPLQARVFFTVDGLNHVHQVGLSADPSTLVALPGQPPADYALGVSGLYGDFETWSDHYINGEGLLGGTVWGLRNWLSTATTIDRVELWRFNEGTNVGQYLTTQPFGVAGHAVGAYAPAGVMIATMRSQEGGVLRCTIVEGRFGDTSGQYGFSAMPPEVQGFFTKQYLDASSPIIAKDTSKPIAFIKQSYSQSEAVFKARFR